MTNTSASNRNTVDINKKLTTPYPHKYKTVLCKYWVKSQSCPFGLECNYAHGQKQLNDKVNGSSDLQKHNSSFVRDLKPCKLLFNEPSKEEHKSP